MRRSPRLPQLFRLVLALALLAVALLVPLVHGKDLVLVETQTMAYLIDGVSSSERVEPSGVELTPDGGILVADDNLPCVDRLRTPGDAVFAVFD